MKWRARAEVVALCGVCSGSVCKGGKKQQM